MIQFVDGETGVMIPTEVVLHALLEILDPAILIAVYAKLQASIQAKSILVPTLRIQRVLRAGG